MVNHRLILAIILICCFHIGLAQTVTMEKAIGISEKFYLSKIDQPYQTPGKLQIDDMALKQSGPFNLYYIINFKKGGFLLVAADERFFPVLAYSFDGRFDRENIPENCQTWIKLYESQIYDALQKAGPFFTGMPEIWEKYLNMGMAGETASGILPLTTSSWAQVGYYNQSCPEDENGYNGHVPVGCVALAMAQLMYYYRFPDTGNGTVNYTPGYDGGVYGPQNIDFSSSTYSWASMADKCREQNDAAAGLCYHAGVAVETEYNPESSGAGILDVPAALSGHFYYKSDNYLERSAVDNTQEWVALLTQNLDKRQPVIYRSSNGWGGHVYICDGYQDSTHFHFNWGWGGAYNGYFYIDNLAPGGIDINAEQGAIFNIFPDTTQFQYPANGSDSTVLETTTGSFEDGSGPSNYLPDTERSWLIKSDNPDITNILLEFSMIDTEAGSDMIRVYDGDSEEAPLISSLSGTDFPVSLYSSGPAMLVVFESDHQNNRNGFQASYYGYHLPFCSGNQLNTDATGFLDDGSKYHYYMNNTDCEWMISPFLSPQDSVDKVSFWFNKFDLASGDTVLIYDGADKLSPLLGRFYQNNVPQSFMVSNGNILLINFITDQENTAQGWEIGWDYILPQYCQDTLIFSTSAGVLSDGSGIKNYIENTDCYYLIDVQEAESIHVVFSEFDMETNYDYLKFFDPGHPYETLLKVSGHDLPAAVTFPLNKLLVHFHSDERDNFSGWKFSYTTGISEVEEISETISFSPNPVLDKLKIKIEGPFFTGAVYRLYRTDGIVILSGKLSDPDQVIDLNRFPSGVYYIIVEKGEEKVLNKILKY